MSRGTLVALVVVALAPTTALAQGINTNVALPVAKGEGIFRSQLRYVQATDDPTPADREVRVLLAPQTLVYGITPRLTAFATLPVLAHRKVEASGETLRKDEEVGDLRLLGRYTLFIDDYAPLSTRRVALLGGMKFPTGSDTSGPDRFGTPSFDPIVGGVATWAANRHELDVDALYTITTERHDFEAGDRFRYDLAYRYRLWPARFGRRTVALHGLVELNGAWTGRSRDDGRTLRNSGGHVLFLSPGLQFVTRRVILEASVQVPIAQDLNGSQLETDVIAVLSLRVPFHLGF